jgi:hypothetical protein
LAIPAKVALSPSDKQSSFDLRFEDVILGRQVLVPQEQFLIDGTRHVSQQREPILLVRRNQNPS